MDNIRLFLWFALLATLWLTYSQWMQDYAPASEPAATSSNGGGAQTDGGGPAGGGEDTLPELDADTTPEAAPEPDGPAAETPRSTISVRTDVLDLEIDPRGGDLVRAELPEYPVTKDRPDDPVRLLDYAPDNRWVFQTGTRNVDGGAEANHLAMFESPSSRYRLEPGEDELVVRLEWASDSPVSVTKVYRFERGSYAIDLDVVVDNGADTAWRGASYAQMARLHDPSGRSFMDVDSYSFEGPVLYDGDEYDKLDVGDLGDDPVTDSFTNGWYAGIQHHFLAAGIPPRDESVRYQAGTRGEQYVLSAITPVREVAPGSTYTDSWQLFVGPKLQEQLTAAAEGLELTVDYGVLTMLAQPLFWVLDKVHSVVGNWGWSIIIVTLLIKLAFYKLTATSGRSMAKMRKIAPRMKQLQERYKDDRQALSQAMMDLYKKEKVNPAAGCLPILIQMPFFFAFYWVLIESVEMRQAPFMLWIDDLSQRDPFFVLPLLMGGAMFLQTRINPAPPDPVQARVMQIIPLVFTVFFAFFPAGLVLYWLTNTALSILQQWRINKIVEADG